MEVAGDLSVMMEIRTPKTGKAKRVLEKRAPKSVSSLILLPFVSLFRFSENLTEIYKGTKL